MPSTTGTAPGTTSPPAPARERGPRLAYLDGLRNVAILYLFPFHTARIFDASEPYYVEGRETVVTTDLVVASFWFMPLLFVLAGMASLFALRRRTAGQYVAERVRRLLVPLLVGLVVLVPPQAYLGRVAHTGEAASLGAYLAFLPGYLGDWSDLSGYHGTFTPGQLWFVAFLLVISLALLPVMRALARRRYAATWARRPAALWLVVPVLAALEALPGISGKNPFVFAGYVMAGFLLASDAGALEVVSRHRRRYAVGAVVGIAAVLVEHHTVGWQSGPTAAGVAGTVLHAAATWAVVLALLGWSRALLDRPSPVMRYLGVAAFPVFVLHQTFLVAVGWLVVGRTGPVAVEFVLVMVGAAAASFAAWEGARRVAVLRWALGVKERPAGG